MIKEVIKDNGSVEKFDLDKLSKWAKYAAKVGGDTGAGACELMLVEDVRVIAN